MNDQERVERFRTIVGRVWPMPTAGDCVRFAYQELGEADSVAMKMGFQGKEYVRNNEIDTEEESKLELEIGQAYMMLLSFASAVGIYDMEKALYSALVYQYSKAKYHRSRAKRLTDSEGVEAFGFFFDEYVGKEYWDWREKE